MYKYGLTFSMNQDYMFPKKDFLMTKPSNEKRYICYAFYSQPLSLVVEHTYHLEYLGRE